MKIKYILLFLIALLLLPFNVNAACVATYGDLQTASQALAGVGGTVEVCDDTYDDWCSQSSPLTLDDSGADDDNHIFIQPETVGGVTFTGHFNANITGSYVTFRNFKFLNNDTASLSLKLITVSGDYVKTSNNSFTNAGINTSQSGGGRAIRYEVGADNGHIEYCTFDTFYNSTPVFIYGLNMHMHHNYLHNAHKTSTSQDSAIQIGDENKTTTDYNAIIEYNYFYDYHERSGGGEAISNKASSVTYRFNVFEISDSLTVRNGDECVLDTNYFINPYRQGARLFGKSHKVLNNYFYGGYTGYPIILFGSGDQDPFQSGTAGYVAFQDAIVASNTFINSLETGSAYGISVGNSKTYPPDTIEFINNLSDQKIGTIYSYGQGTNLTYTTNLCNNYDAATYETGEQDFCTTEETSTRLSFDGYVYRLGAGTTNGTADGDVTDDFDLESRANPPDIGCDEWVDGLSDINYIQPAETGVSWNRLTISDPTPQGGGIAITADLNWTKPLDQTDCDVYYDCTDGSTLVVDGVDVETYAIPGDIANNTTCYWSVVVNADSEAIINGPYTFTTAAGPPIVAESLSGIVQNAGAGRIGINAAGLTIANSP